MNSQSLKIFISSLLILILNGCYQPSIDPSNKIVFERNSRFTSGIWIMDENGKNQTVLVKKEEKGVTLTSPVWAPDGGKIFFLEVNSQEKKWSLWIMDVIRKEKVRVTEENFIISSPTWLPDGNGIAVSSKYNDYWQIWTMEINEKTWKRLTDSPIDKIGIEYSPCKKKILFFTQENVNGDIIDKVVIPIEHRKFDIYVIDSDGKNLKKLTDNPANDEDPCWSPGGEKIVYTAFCDNNYEIFVMDKDGNNKKRLTYNSVDDFVPTWSPDGKKIAFISDGMLYLMDPDGKNQVKLVDKTYGGVIRFSWSPDSKKIAFEVYDIKNENFDIYTINIDSKNLKNLTNTPDWDESNPSWQPIPKD